MVDLAGRPPAGNAPDAGPDDVLIAPEIAFEHGVLRAQTCVYGDCDATDLHVGVPGLGVAGPSIEGGEVAKYYESVTLVLASPRAIEYSVRYGDEVDKDGDGVVRHGLRVYRDGQLILHSIQDVASGTREYTSDKLPIADKLRGLRLAKSTQPGPTTATRSRSFS